MSSPAPSPSASPASRMTIIQMLVCVTASIGFAFDTYELLMLPLIAPSAILELTGARPGSPESLQWIGRLFYIPAFAGAVFGLWGGWLTDRFGRRRVLTGSILLYAFAAFVSGYSNSIQMLLICRCLVFIGVCVEFVAAVAWLAELFDDPRQRERVIGFTQAFGSVGGLLVAFVNHALADQARAGGLPSIWYPGWMQSLLGPMENPDLIWRYTLMSGLAPAIPLIIVRPFLPESPKWQLKAKAGALKRPTILALFTPELRRTTIVSTLLVACSFGFAFGGLQQLPQIVPGLPEVRQSLEGLTPDTPQYRGVIQGARATYSKYQEFGGLAGRLALAFLALWIVSRRKLMFAFVLPCFILLPALFYGFSRGVTPSWPLQIGTFLAGALVIGQFSFWGNYLPRVFPLHLRGTGESMAANIGGRMLGTCCALLTTKLAAQAWFPGAPGPAKIGLAAAYVVTGLAGLALILTFFLPEPSTAHDGDE